MTAPHLSLNVKAFFERATLALVTAFLGMAVLLPSNAKAQATVNLGTATDFSVLAGSGITNTGATTISGNVGTFPNPAITGFGTVTLNGTNQGGNAVTQQAKIDLVTAFNNAASRTPNTVFAPAFDLGGQTLAPGVYANPSSFGLTGSLTLDGMGDPNAVWIFQTGSTLTTATSSMVTLINGAEACNIFWQIGSSATLGSATAFMGSILAFTSITLGPGATIEGRLLALNGAVTLDNNVITLALCEVAIAIDGDVALPDPTTVVSVVLEDCSQLLVLDTLTISEGIVSVPTGQALIAGGTVIIPGDFNKVGAGTLVTDTALQVGNTANINQGGLIVNGTLQASQVNVQPGASLGGGGLIIGNVFNSGIVSAGSLPGCIVEPGNEVGTLLVQGNYTQNPGGTLQVEIGSLSSFDRLIISGNANLSGILEFIPLGGFTLEYGQQFSGFLQADSFTGSFDSILLPDGFRGRIVQEGGMLTLIIAPESYTQVAETPNQEQVARALDSFIPATGDDRETVSLALDQLTENEYAQAFNEIGPGFYESLGIIAIEQTNAQNQFLAQRMSAVRLGGTRGYQESGIANPLVHDRDGKSVVGAKDGKSVLDSRDAKNFISDESHDVLSTDPGNKWGVWVLGNGNFGRISNVSQIPNSNFESGGFLVGADYQWTKNLTTGIFGGYQGLYSKYNNGSRTTINSALFGVYASYQYGGFYSDAIVSGGYSNYNERRSIQFGSIDRTAQSGPDGGQFSTYLGVGYDWTIGNFTFGPILGMQYTYAGIAPFTETQAGSLNLQVDQQNVNSLRSSLGGRIAYTWNVTKNIALIPEVRMLWQHEFMENSRNIQSSLDGGSGPEFGYQTSNPDRDSVFAGAGLIAQFGQNWSASVYYNADFGRQDYLSHMVSVGAGVRF